MQPAEGGAKKGGRKSLTVDVHCHLLTLEQQ